MSKKTSLSNPDFEPFMKLAEQLSGLHDQALRVYEPLVDGIIRSKNRDVRMIEQMLDGLLGFCCDDRALEVYRRLCRYYWDIDPVATADYVMAYRDMWDSEEEQNTEPTAGDSSDVHTEGGKP